VLLLYTTEHAFVVRSSVFNSPKQHWRLPLIRPGIIAHWQCVSPAGGKRVVALKEAKLACWQAHIVCAAAISVHVYRPFLAAHQPLHPRAAN
jgi:hypothetical protein